MDGPLIECLRLYLSRTARPRSVQHQSDVNYPDPLGSVFIQTRDILIHITTENVFMTLKLTARQPKKRKDESLWTAAKNTGV